MAESAADDLDRAFALVHAAAVTPAYAGFPGFPLDCVLAQPMQEARAPGVRTVPDRTAL